MNYTSVALLTFFWVNFCNFVIFFFYLFHTFVRGFFFFLLIFTFGHRCDCCYRWRGSDNLQNNRPRLFFPACDTVARPEAYNFSAPPVVKESRY